MSQLILSQEIEIEENISDWNRIIRLGGVVSWIQLALLLFMTVVLELLGGIPATVSGYYETLQNDGLIGILRLDLGTIILLALFPFVAVAVYGAFRRSRPAYGMLTMTMILIGTLLGLANESAFSLMYLSDLYAKAATISQQEQLITVGEAILAGNMWHTTAGFLAGIFMQGAFVFISYIMLKSKGFSRWTAYTGILSNGLDLIHVFVALFAPVLAAALLALGGVFYLFWFALLGRDLYKLGQS